MLNVLAQLLQNPVAFIAILVEFILGFSLGYVSIKAIKYILALIAILVAGALLNIWSLGLSLETLVSRFGEYTVKAKDLIMGLAGSLGLLIIGPVMIGFIVGVIAAAVKGK
ncbi:MAG: hypothetical protein QXE14_00240 [Candidatus Bathyarchaeia archaeon]